MLPAGPMSLRRSFLSTKTCVLSRPPRTGDVEGTCKQQQQKQMFLYFISLVEWVFSSEKLSIGRWLEFLVIIWVHNDGKRSACLRFVGFVNEVMLCGDVGRSETASFFGHVEFFREKWIEYILWKLWAIWMPPKCGNWNNSKFILLRGFYVSGYSRIGLYQGTFYWSWLAAEDLMTGWRIRKRRPGFKLITEFF